MQGYKEGGSLFAVISSKNVNVCVDNDNDGYFSNSCGGTDCNDNNSSINPGATEVCNSVDDDCDGLIDEGCSCTSGQQQNCGSNIGACQFGTQTCSSGQWGSCVGRIGPVPEMCPHNGIDDDCDGVIDENVCGGQECYDPNWHADPTGVSGNYIDDVDFGPYCANGYSWHVNDIDNDGYEGTEAFKAENQGGYNQGVR